MYIEYISIFYGAPLVALVVKNLPAKGGDIRVTASTPGSGRSPGGGRGNPLQYSQPTPVFSTHSSILNPLQYSRLENPTDRRAWRTTVHRFAKSWTQL